GAGAPGPASGWLRRRCLSGRGTHRRQRLPGVAIGLETRPRTRHLVTAELEAKLEERLAVRPGILAADVTRDPQRAEQVATDDDKVCPPAAQLPTPPRVGTPMPWVHRSPRNGRMVERRPCHRQWHFWKIAYRANPVRSTPGRRAAADLRKPPPGAA